MKVAFFTHDENNCEVASLDNNSFQKLLQAIKYGFERAMVKAINVRIVVVLGPNTQIDSEQADKAIMAQVKEKIAHILVTMEDFLILQTEDKEQTLTIKIVGGTVKFVRPQEEDDGDSNGSEFDNFENYRLIQECNMNAFN